ncbi:FecR domain-containing protein [Desulfospira joergensenii]|uniref:FecR domain-containing protein n=1 Tax=Desulfospira joergensenii TaxID=53329 RepID=UPI0003B38EA9|nr:FecR domain-containing protein [Desulfospira joergensenii]
MKLRFSYMAGGLILGGLILMYSQVLGKSLPEDIAGSVVALRGKATAALPGSAPRPLSLKSPVFVRDIIQTGRARLQLMFKDNTLITLGRNSEMVIQEYLWKSGSRDSAMHTRVKAGSFRIMGGAITREAPENFTTQTPAATIGIRGSMYAGLVRGNSLSVVFQGGRGIFVSNGQGRVNIDIPGFGTRVEDPQQAPETPEKFNEESLQEIEGDLALLDTGEEGEQSPGSEGEGESLAADEGESGESGLLSSVPDSPDPLESPIPTDIDLTTDTLPASGIWIYKGKLTSNIGEIIDETIAVYINWENRRVMIIENDPDLGYGSSQGFAIGEISKDGKITISRIMGSGVWEDMGTVEAMTGSGTGSAEGLDYGTIQMVLEGYDINVQDQSDPSKQRFWSDTLAAVVYDKAEGPGLPDTITLNGFFLGVGEDMADPNTGRTAFMNSDATDFQITIDRVSGTLIGSMAGEDWFNPSNDMDNISLGGDKTKSVYISDDKMAAVIGGSLSISASTAGLKPHGNFMVSSAEAPLSQYTTWGYWEIAYEEPGSNEDYHVHVPGAFWIAGEQTPVSKVSQLIADSTTPDGVYTGKARGVRFNSSSQMSQLTNGKTQLTIKFDTSVSNPVSGFIKFDQKNLAVESIPGDVFSDGSGFKGTVSTAGSSRVRGAFFGSDAQAIGGNFAADMPDGYSYQGIFAGNQ